MIIILGLVILVAVHGRRAGQRRSRPCGDPFRGVRLPRDRLHRHPVLYGIITGALAMAGLSLLLAGARRTSLRGRDARRGLAQSRRETAAVSADRDDLRGQRDTARAYTASTLGDHGTAPNGTDPGLRGPSLSERLFARRPAPPAPPRSQMRWPARRPPHRRSPRPARPPRSKPARPRPRSDSPVTGVITARPAAPPESGRPGSQVSREIAR